MVVEAACAADPQPDRRMPRGGRGDPLDQRPDVAHGTVEGEGDVHLLCARPPHAQVPGQRRDDSGPDGDRRDQRREQPA
nr:hypothetical protein [Tomitella gaofuii]